MRRVRSVLAAPSATAQPANTTLSLSCPPGPPAASGHSAQSKTELLAAADYLTGQQWPTLRSSKKNTIYLVLSQ